MATDAPSLDNLLGLAWARFGATSLWNVARSARPELVAEKLQRRGTQESYRLGLAIQEQLRAR